MEQRNAVSQGPARPRPPRTAEERQRDRRLALSLLTRLAAAAAALTVLLGVVLLVTQAEGQDMFPAVKDGDLLIAYRLQRRWRRTTWCCTGRRGCCGWAAWPPWAAMW